LVYNVLSLNLYCSQTFLHYLSFHLFLTSAYPMTASLANCRAHYVIYLCFILLTVSISLLTTLQITFLLAIGINCKHLSFSLITLIMLWGSNRVSPFSLFRFHLRNYVDLKSTIAIYTIAKIHYNIIYYYTII